jgi:hypothetical protein
VGGGKPEDEIKRLNNTYSQPAASRIEDFRLKLQVGAKSEELAKAPRKSAKELRDELDSIGYNLDGSPK